MSLTKVSYSMIQGTPVNVLDYGADPTGATDSTAALQAAFDYAGSISINETALPYLWSIKGGATVVLPEGKFIISGTLNVPQNVSISGAGQNSTIIKSSYDGIILRNYCVPTVTGTYDQSGVIWQNFGIVGTNTLTNQIGINLLRWNYSQLSNVVVENCGSHGIVLAQALGTIFTGVQCLNNTGIGLAVRDGYNSTTDGTANNLPTNGCIFNGLNLATNGSFGLLLAEYGSGTGVNGCSFNACAAQYNCRESTPGTGANISITTTSYIPNEFNDCWLEDSATTGVGYHILIDSSNASIPVRFTNLHHFGNGPTSYPIRCMLVNNGVAFIDGAYASNTSYKNLSGSISPFRVNEATSRIYATNLNGALVTDNKWVDNLSNVSTGLYNNVRMNNEGDCYGYFSNTGPFGNSIGQWVNETQTYPFAQMVPGYGLIMGSGSVAPTSQFQSGAGSPNGQITAPVGSLYTRTDGGANTTLYIKESGTSNTGWVAK